MLNAIASLGLHITVGLRKKGKGKTNNCYVLPSLPSKIPVAGSGADLVLTFLKYSLFTDIRYQMIEWRPHRVTLQANVCSVRRNLNRN